MEKKLLNSVRKKFEVNTGQKVVYVPEWRFFEAKRSKNINELKKLGFMVQLVMEL